MQLAALQQAFYQAMITGNYSQELLGHIVNDHKLASKLFSWGVTSVFSNFPDKVINL